MSGPDQQTIDERNASFWDELCGSALARSIGATDDSPESLRRFDQAYMDLYPYLPKQLPAPRRPGESLLEIGLGYGTVSQRLAQAGFLYHGLDIAPGPVEIVRERLRRLGEDDVEQRVQQGSALAIPHPEETFETLVTIGCLHHTGDLPRAVAEVHRVLKPGGRALVMLYNRHSARQLAITWRQRLGRLRGGEEARRAAYDVNAAGEAAPATVFVTARQVREELFANFSRVTVQRHNFDATRLASVRGRTLWLTRERALPTIARILGLDLYIHAVK